MAVWLRVPGRILRMLFGGGCHCWAWKEVASSIVKELKRKHSGVHCCLRDSTNHNTFTLAHAKNDSQDAPMQNHVADIILKRSQAQQNAQALPHPSKSKTKIYATYLVTERPGLVRGSPPPTTGRPLAAPAASAFAFFFSRAAALTCHMLKVNHTNHQSPITHHLVASPLRVL